MPPHIIDHVEIMVWTNISLTDVLRQVSPRQVLQHYGHERMLNEIGYERAVQFVRRVQGESSDVTPPPANGSKA